MGINNILPGPRQKPSPLFSWVYVASPSLVKVRRITAPFLFRVLVGRWCSQRWRGTIYRAAWSGPPLFPPPTPLLGRGGINTWWYDVSMHYPSLAQGGEVPPRATPGPPESCTAPPCSSILPVSTNPHTHTRRAT